MTVPIGSARRRASAPEPSARSVIWQRLSGRMGLRRRGEEQDQAHLDRGQAMAAFLRGEPVPNMWPQYLQPQMLAIGDALIEQMLEEARTVESPASGERLRFLLGSLSAWEKIARSYDEAINLAEGAMARMAERKLQDTVKAEVSKERTTA